MSDEEPKHVIFHVEKHSKKLLVSPTPRANEYSVRVELVGIAEDESLADKVVNRMRGLKVYGGETLSDQAIAILKEDLALERKLREDDNRRNAATITELQSDLSFAQQDLARAKERVAILEQMELELGNLSRLPVN